jgi:hypothetical protein
MTVRFYWAWCDQLQDTISIVRARDYAMSFDPPARLTFRCADAKCRASANPAVSGVLYRVDLPSSGARRSPYFSTARGQRHRDGCNRHEYGCGAALADPVRTIGPDATKRTNVIDVFVSRQGDGPKARNPGGSGDSEPSDAAAESSGRVRRPASGLSGEFRVGRLWDIYVSLADAQSRAQATVLFNGQEISYLDLFIDSRDLPPAQIDGSRIIFGKARYSRSANRSAFLLEFYEPLSLFSPIGPGQAKSRQLQIRLPIDRLRRSMVGLDLLAQLTASGTERAHYFLVAALGTVQPAPVTGYAVELVSLFDVHLLPLMTKKSMSENMMATAQNARR